MFSKREPIGRLCNAPQPHAPRAGTNQGHCNPRDCSEEAERDIRALGGPALVSVYSRVFGAMPIVTIDGTAASGKNWAGEAIARRLALPLIDTGAFFRAVAWRTIEAQIDATDSDAVARVAKGLDFRFMLVSDPIDHANSATRVFDGQTDLTEILWGREQLEIGVQAGKIAGNPDVRRVYRSVMKASETAGMVTIGRDVGTIFPEAPVRLLFSCDLDVRAHRRATQAQSIGVSTLKFEDLLAQCRTQLAERDLRDAVNMTRAGDEVIVFDSSSLEKAAAAAKAIECVETRLRHLCTGKQ